MEGNYLLPIAEPWGATELLVRFCSPRESGGGLPPAAFDVLCCECLNELEPKAAGSWALSCVVDGFAPFP